MSQKLPSMYSFATRKNKLRLKMSLVWTRYRTSSERVISAALTWAPTSSAMTWLRIPRLTGATWHTSRKVMQEEQEKSTSMGTLPGRCNNKEETMLKHLLIKAQVLISTCSTTSSKAETAWENSKTFRISCYNELRANRLLIIGFVLAQFKIAFIYI